MNKALALILALVASTAVLAHDYRLDQLEVDHPWSRPTPPNAQVGGGFMTITNHGNDSDRLISVEVDFAQRVEIHETRQDGELMRMVHLPEGIEIPAGESVHLKPGGYHVMFMGLAQALREGEQLDAVLVFERSGSLAVKFHVENQGSGGHNHGHDHSHDHGHSHDHH